MLNSFTQKYYKLYFLCSICSYFGRPKRSNKKGGKTVKQSRKRNNQGLTEYSGRTRMVRVNKEKKEMNSRLLYRSFNWTEDGSKEYWKAITDVNKAYRKMLMIGKADEAFRSSDEGLEFLLNTNDVKEFKRALKNINNRYRNHVKADKGMLNNIALKDLEILPDPRTYANRENQQLPTKRDVLMNEEILEFEHYLSTLNMHKCSICMECKIQVKPPSDNRGYVCQDCVTRRDDNFYIKNNLHPVWYLRDDDGEEVLDEHHKPIPQYHIPTELSCLTMYEQLLIRRCANFIPTIHLKGGVFAIKGHAVTFPQDITDMCNELPQKKDTILTFIRNIGNRTTSSYFPTSLRVRRQQVLDALVWLKRHNRFYENIQIKEENMEWMEGRDEVNLCTKALELEIKTTDGSNKQDNEEEYVSPCHKVDQGKDEIPMTTIHSNDKVALPRGESAKPIKEFMDIAKKKGEISRIMHFPPIDHDSPIS